MVTPGPGHFWSDFYPDSAIITRRPAQSNSHTPTPRVDDVYRISILHLNRILRAHVVIFGFYNRISQLRQSVGFREREIAKMRISAIANRHFIAVPKIL